MLFLSVKLRDQTDRKILINAAAIECVLSHEEGGSEIFFITSAEGVDAYQSSATVAPTRQAILQTLLANDVPVLEVE